MVAVTQALGKPGHTPVTAPNAVSAAQITSGFGSRIERDAGFGAVARAQALGGDAAGAVRTATGISDDSQRATALRAIAAAHAAAGDETAALAWARAETVPVVRAQSLLGVAEGILQRRGPGD